MALITPSACSQSESDRRGIKPGDTQIVAQWLTKDLPIGLFAGVSDDRIAKACHTLCFVDGNDVGSGTCNIYVYAGDVQSTVNLLIALEHKKQLPTKMRIGVAHYTDAGHKNWTYEAVYPAGSRQFSLMYRSP
ncbi:MAG: hypothetical protein WAW96_15215 [Alphaproteobacteria bacterium]